MIVNSSTIFLTLFLGRIKLARSRIKKIGSKLDPKFREGWVSDGWEVWDRYFEVWGEGGRFERLGQCPKFSRFWILEVSKKRNNRNLRAESLLKQLRGRQ